MGMYINITLDNIYDLALGNSITGHFETPSKGQLNIEFSKLKHV